MRLNTLHRATAGLSEAPFVASWITRRSSADVIEPNAGVPATPIGSTQRWGIGKVEELRAKFQVGALPDGRALHDREIRGAIRRAAHRVSRAR